MKILFLFTGGTIGSTTRGGTISTDNRKPYLLLETYRKRHGLEGIDYDVAEPYTALSENNTGATVRLLLESVAQYLDRDYDGIVVTHGTDTLQYSAAALSYAFSDIKIPICLVSSNYPIEKKEANGIPNLRGALRFIAEVGTPGVFVPYQNHADELRIHRGTRLQASSAFSDRVESIFDSYYGIFREGEPFVPNAAYRELPDALPAFGALPVPESCREIMILEPYPGKLYPPIAESVKYILHAAYHSGTINTEAEETARFFEEIRRRGITPFLLGATGGATYESTKMFTDFNLAPLYNLAPIAAFVKLWFFAIRYPEQAVTAEQLLSPLGGDIVPQ